MDWKHNYDPDVGLWWADKTGHTPATLSLTRTRAVAQGACALLTACQLGEIHHIDTLKVLSAIRAKQSQDASSPGFGQLCFFWEEPVNHDGNASFFAGMPLALLYGEYLHLLEPQSQILLKTILKDLSVWFSTKLDHDKAYYPNSYIGELVVSYLVASASDDQPTMLRVHHLLDNLITRYKSDGWGWGEDLSDIYSRILCDQLSMLIFLTRTLPPQTKIGLLDLLNHLLFLDDQFRPGPRLPSIRTYSFLQTPHHPDNSRAQRLTSYRESVRPWGPSETINFRHVAPIGNLLYLRGWHDAVNPPQPRQTQIPAQIQVKCHDNNFAKAWVFPDARFGAMARFPIMPSAENQDWGLAWQSMPVGYWHQAADWAYMQWRVQPRPEPTSPSTSNQHQQTQPLAIGHPAIFSKESNLGAIQKSLTPDINPPLFGETFTLWSDTGVLILRRMRTLTKSWATLTDGWRVVDTSTTPTQPQPPSSNCHQLHLPYPARTIALTYLDPWKNRQPQLATSTPNLLDFHVNITPGENRGYIGLWALCFDIKNNPGFCGPNFEPHFEKAPGSENAYRSQTETAFKLNWQWPSHTWRVLIDPLAPAPLINCS